MIDTVIMGHEELWQIKAERDRIYALPEMSEDDGMAVAELEVQFAEFDGYTAESRAGELLLGLGIPLDQHFGPMSAVAPGWKLRVLLAQALFSDPEVLLLDEPTNHLDINTIRWLESVLTARNSTMIIISHDRHFLNSVCTHMADLDYGELRLFPGNYDEYMTAATQARERLLSDNAKKKAQIAELQTFVSRFSANASKAKQATSRAKLIDKIQLEGGQAVQPGQPVHPLRAIQEAAHRQAVTLERLSQGYDGTALFKNLNLQIEAGERVAIIGPNGIGKTTLVGDAGRRDAAAVRRSEMDRKRRCRLFRPGPCRGLRGRRHAVRLDEPMDSGRRTAGAWHPRAHAVLQRRDQEIGEGDFRG
ncbi:putative ABC transporter ATP-binding protein YbiT [Stutzerimonas stutzeri]